MSKQIQEWGNGTNVCDYSHNTREEIRRLPTGGNSAVLVCYRHYLEEMAYRREMVSAGTWTKENTDFPKWRDLEIYTQPE